jgi:hypothetical protein
MALRVVCCPQGYSLLPALDIPWHNQGNKEHELNIGHRDTKTCARCKALSPKGYTLVTWWCWTWNDSCCILLWLEVIGSPPRLRRKTGVAEDATDGGPDPAASGTIQ